ncbi:hypothetical protein Tco_0851100 [Tanacetum coccineum]
MELELMLIVDFLNAHTIKYALTINPTIYTLCIEQFWATVKAKTVNGEVQLQALVDRKKIIITESIVRRDLQLEYDEGVDCLPNATIFKQLTLMSSKTTAWNEFSSTMASANICLATNQKFNFSKYIFKSMVKNLDNVGKFFMYPRVGKGFSGIVTPLFPTMMTQKPKRPKRKDTEVPQPSGPTTNVADETVNEEMDDSLVRAATTTSSLETEQDSGSGPRRQETMGDTISQTRSENVSKLSNDPLLARGNTLRSGSDSLNFRNMMALCTTFQSKVLALKTTKTTQVNEIVGLKRRVKKLKRRSKSRTYGLKRLYKVGLSRRVESSDDEEVFARHDMAEKEINVAEKEVSIVDLVTSASEVVTTTSVKISTPCPTETTITDDLTLAHTLIEIRSAKPKVKGVVIGEQSESTTRTRPQQLPSKDKGKGKMVEPKKPIKKKELIRLDEEIASKLQAKFDKEAKIEADHELAQTLQAQEQEELSDVEKTTLFVQLLVKRRKHFAAKRAEEKRNKPPTQAQQIKIMCTYLKNMERKKPKDLKNISFDSIQKMFDRAFEWVNTFVDFITDLVEGTKVDDDQEAAKIKELIEIFPDKEEVANDAIPLATKPSSIVDWKIHKEWKKTYYQIIKADESSKMYLVFSYMLKSFDRKDLETLWKLVKAKNRSTRPEEGNERVL